MDPRTWGTCKDDLHEVRIDFVTLLAARMTDLNPLVAEIHFMSPEERKRYAELVAYERDHPFVETL